MKAWIIFLLLLFTVLCSSLCSPVCLLTGVTSQGDYFYMSDPTGDEHGYGAYQYPTNIAFQPYQGLFDITQFRVSAGTGSNVYFDTTFQGMTNPWVAPEGFIHQNIRIFLDTIPNQGAVVLPERGAQVRFNPKYAWDICLKVVGWGNSQLITISDGALKVRPLKVELLNDGKTIRTVVPEKEIGRPAKSWHYYILVGSYDGFGQDFFRKVEPKPGEWVIGGGYGNNIDPRVMDLLALANGPHSQEKQLHSFDPASGQLAELYPVGPGIKDFNLRAWILWILLIILLSAIIYLIKRKPWSISWFWVKGDKNKVSE